MRANDSLQPACHKVPKPSSESAITCYPRVDPDAILHEDKEQTTALQDKASMLKDPHHQLESKLRSNLKTHNDLFSTNGHDIQDMLSGPNVPQLQSSSTSYLEKPNSNCLTSQHQPTLLPSDAPAISPCYNVTPVMGTTLNGTEYFPIVIPHDTGMCGTKPFLHAMTFSAKVECLLPRRRDRRRKMLTRLSAAHKVYQNPFRTTYQCHISDYNFTTNI